MKEVKTSRIFRLIPFLLCAILIAGMTACGDDDEKDVPIGPNGPAPDFAIDFPDSIRIPATGDTLSGTILCDSGYVGDDNILLRYYMQQGIYFDTISKTYQPDWLQLDLLKKGTGIDSTINEYNRLGERVGVRYLSAEPDTIEVVRFNRDQRLEVYIGPNLSKKERRFWVHVYLFLFVWCPTDDFYIIQEPAQ